MRTNNYFIRIFIKPGRPPGKRAVWNNGVLTQTQEPEIGDEIFLLTWDLNKIAVRIVKILAAPGQVIRKNKKMGICYSFPEILYCFNIVIQIADIVDLRVEIISSANMNADWIRVGNFFFIGLYFAVERDVVDSQLFSYGWLDIFEIFFALEITI